jgi:hypothetical protein
MRRHALTGVLAAIALCVATSAASANNLRISEQSFRLTWSAATIAAQPEAGFRVECPLTLEGSFHSLSTEKVVGQLLGYIARTSLGTCTGGTGTALTETLPWHIRYEGFTGSLPNITGVSAAFSGLSLGVTKGGLPCLLRTDAEHLVSATAIRESLSTVTGVRFDETDVITGGTNVFCRMLRFSLSGTGRFLSGGGGAFRYVLS